MSRFADIKPIPGFIGLGNMGGAMARNLVTGSGLSVVVYDVNPEACADCAAVGAIAAEDPAAVARNCAIIFLSLPGEAEVRSVCLGRGGLLENVGDDTIIVDCSTVPVNLSQEVAGRFAAKGVAYVDAPIAGTVQSVVQREISILVGAEPGTFSRIESWLKHMAEHVQHCGGSGAGTTTKLLLNMVIAQSVVALAETLVLGKRAGLDGNRLFEALRNGCDSFVLRQHGFPSLLPGVFPKDRFSTRYMFKDIGYVQELKETLALTLPGMDLTHDLLRKTVAAGHGEDYWPSVINVIGQDGTG